MVTTWLLSWFHIVTIYRKLEHITVKYWLLLLIRYLQLNCQCLVLLRYRFIFGFKACMYMIAMERHGNIEYLKNGNERFILTMAFSIYYWLPWKQLPVYLHICTNILLYVVYKCQISIFDVYFIYKYGQYRKLPIVVM